MNFKNNLIKDAHGYHKSLFTANNADAVANDAVDGRCWPVLEAAL